MNRNDIIRMAREAGFTANDEDGVFLRVFASEIERFAALVAAVEREACAQLCDEEAERLGWPTDRFAADNCAIAIRARKDNP